jgi:riboflavin kinase/FMN adenylyltransferase
MEIFDLRGGDAVKAAWPPSIPAASVVALGNFDGVHIGHARLIKTAADEARRRGAHCVVWTFAAPPRLLTDRSGAAVYPPRLTGTAEKLRLIAALGADFAALEEFDDVRDMEPEEFVRERLIKTFGCVCAAAGFNFRFGRNAAGDADALTKLCGEGGASAIIADPVYFGGEPVSSSRIRLELAAGRVEAAAAMLGRPYSLTAPVAHGYRLGTSIGIPTANQRFAPDAAIPARGVYAASVDVGGAVYRGVANVGVRPTVSDSGDLNCETHIIGFDGDLYGATITVSFLRRLRGESRFPSVEQLRAQIMRDIAEAKRL